jgi:hypothetical protein
MKNNKKKKGTKENKYIYIYNEKSTRGEEERKGTHKTSKQRKDKPA